jgi:hypothetical protein
MENKNLGLDNFWNPMKEKYPHAVEEFCQWIDKYKELVQWKTFMPEAKFHDLPLDFQFGIFMGYCNQRVEKDKDDPLAIISFFVEGQLDIIEGNLTAVKLEANSLEELPNWDKLSKTTNEDLKEKAEQGKVVSINSRKQEAPAE